MMPSAMVSSRSDDWPTPPDLFAKLSRRYGPFDLDPAASPDNAKAPRYFTVAEDGLQQTWTGRVWLNPPYGRDIGKWVRKAWDSARGGATVVCLVPARVDTKWWQDVVQPFATKIQFLRGRVRFVGSTHGAPFPSALVVFSPRRESRCWWCERPFVPARKDAKFCSAGCKQAAYRARRVTDISVTWEATER